MDQASVLGKAKQLREGISQLAELYDQDRWSEAGPLRTKLNMLWGEVGGALTAAGIASEWEQAGRTFPIMETALSRYSDGVNRQAMDHALDSLETTIGRISSFPSTWRWSPGRRSANEAAAPDAVQHKPSRFPRFQAGLLLGGGLAWLICQRRDQVIGAFTSPEGVRLGKLGIVLVTILAGAVCGNLFASLVHDRGWVGAFKTAPFRSTIYVLVALVGGYFALTVASGRG